MPSQFLLQTFGTLALARPESGQAIFANHRRRLALLAVLAADANHGVARERLFGIFWPDSDGEHARNALNQIVFAIRRDLGDDALHTDAFSLRLNASIVDSDVRRFREALAAGRFADAIASYHGPFLDGAFLRDAPAMERWTEEQRQSFGVDYARALEREIDSAQSAGGERRVDAVHFARLLAQYDPLNTASAIRLMRALEQAGDVSAALRHAATHTAHIRVELESEPWPELAREVARLQGATIPDRIPPVDAASGSSRAVDSSAAEQLVVTTARPRRVVLGGMVVAIMAMAAFFVRGGAERLQTLNGTVLDQNRVVVASFDNRTGDSSLDYLGYVTADWITQALSQSEIANVVYGPTAYELSRSAPGGTSTETPERVRHLAAGAGAGTVVVGSYYVMNDSIVFSAIVMEGSSAQVVRTIPVTAAPKSDPMRAVSALRERTVGALATLIDPRLASVSGISSAPPQIDAYRDYLEALDLFRQGQRPKVAMARFLVAARRDSSFMLPVIWATWLAGFAGELAARDSLLNVLESHRRQLAPIDRYSLDFLKISRDSSVPPPQRLAAVHRIVLLAPASNWAWIEAGCRYSAGQAKEALALLEGIDPEHGWAGAWPAYWTLLFRVQHSLGLYGAELRSAERSAVLGGKVGVQRGLGARIVALIALGLADSALSLVPRTVTSTGSTYDIGFLESLVPELQSHGRRAQGDSLGNVVLSTFQAQWREKRTDEDRMIFHLTYLGAALEFGETATALRVANAILVDGAALEYDRDEYLVNIHGALAIAAAVNGNRRRMLAEIALMPEKGRLTRFMRWDSALLKAKAAGALHDGDLTLHYLAEMESQGAQGPPDAAWVTAHSPYLWWIAKDPLMLLPYVGGPEWAAPTPQ